MSIGNKKSGYKTRTYGSRLTTQLRSFLKTKGCDLVGFGSVERMRGAPENMAPSRYLPDALSMVSIALHINEASCDLIAQSVRDGCSPPSYHSYQVFTLGIINDELDRLAYLGAKFLEDHGFKAYPFPANIPHVLKPSKKYPGGPGDISHRHVAAACGLGEIGWHNLLINPLYGSRLKLTTLVTDALLEPDQVLEKKMCEPAVCGFLCANACPTYAIPSDREKMISIEIGGKKVEYGKISGWKCRWGCSGMLKVTGGYTDIPLPQEEPSDTELLKYKAQIDPWQERLKTYAGLLPYCGRCLSICCCPRTV